MAEHILLVDDTVDSRYALERLLVHHGYRVSAAGGGEEAIAAAQHDPPTLILLDVMMPGVDGLEVTRRVKADPILRFVPVILLTAKDSLDDIVKGLDAGADGYITKPFKTEELLARTRAAIRMRSVYEALQQSEEQNQRLLEEVQGTFSVANIVGESPKLQQALALTAKVAMSDTSVLVTGPSGSGKELIAKSIHYGSPRRDKAFIAVNCAAFSEHLLESQLFGHTKGAFTGAVKDTRGLFDAAHGGTLFLDEIAEMNPQLQAKLLRVLQEGTFIPVGSTEERKVDVRIIAATNKDLLEQSEKGTFRDDLYYRLAVITIVVPALQERPADIPLLVRHFLTEFRTRRGGPERHVSAEAIRALQSHRWRGNIRELRNEIERMLILAGDSAELGVDLLSPHIVGSGTGVGATTAPTINSEEDLRTVLEQVERQMILAALDATGWNKSNAAKRLGISRSNLIAKVQQYGLAETA